MTNGMKPRLVTVSPMKTGVQPPRDFEALPMHDQELWLIRARNHLDKTGISYTEDMRDPVLYMTAVFLYTIDPMILTGMAYPCYVVHCVEEGWRFVTDSFAIAHSKFKRAAERSTSLGKHRVALFKWDADRKCEKRYATEGYPFETDYQPM